MPFHVLPAAISDAPAITHVTSLAFTNDVLNKSITRQHLATSAQREQYVSWRVQTISQEIQRDDRCWFTAVNTETGKLVGCSLILRPDDSEQDPRKVRRQANSEELDIPDCVDTTVLALVEQAMTEARKNSIGERKDVWCMHSSVSYLCITMPTLTKHRFSLYGRRS